MQKRNAVLCQHEIYRMLYFKLESSKTKFHCADIFSSTTSESKKGYGKGMSSLVFAHFARLFY